METHHAWLGYLRNVPFNHVALLTLLVATVDCSFQDHEYLQEGGVTSGGRNTGSGARGGRGGNGHGGSSGTGTAAGGLTSSGGTSNAAGGSTNLPSGGSGTAGATSSPSGTFGPWEFNTLEDALQWPPSGNSIPAGAAVDWTAQGEQEPLGALVITTTGASTFQVTVPPANADQSHRKVFFRVRAESGTAKVKPYVFGTGWKWSDGGEFSLTTEWSTAMIDLDNPSYESAGYSASSIINIGLELPCPSTPTQPLTWVVWVDRAWIE